MQQAVATELPRARSVTAAAATTPTDNRPSQNAQDYSRVVIFDAKNNEVIYRLVDVRSLQVVRQLPEEGVLRLRAYTRAILDGERPIQAKIDINLIA